MFKYNTNNLGLFRFQVYRLLFLFVDAYSYWFVGLLEFLKQNILSILLLST